MTATNPAVVGEREVLLPCPFCGSGDTDTEGYHHGLRQHYLACRECDCEGPYTESHREAVAAWNRRAARAPLRDAPPDQKESGESKKNQQNSGPEVERARAVTAAYERGWEAGYRAGKDAGT